MLPTNLNQKTKPKEQAIKGKTKLNCPECFPKTPNQDREVWTGRQPRAKLQQRQVLQSPRQSLCLRRSTWRILMDELLVGRVRNSSSRDHHLQRVMIRRAMGGARTSHIAAGTPGGWSLEKQNKKSMCIEELGTHTTPRY